MRENRTQSAQTGEGNQKLIEYDWFPGSIPPNVVLGNDVYIDSSYGFAAFHSKLETGFELGNACGIYDRASFIVGPEGSISVGDFTILNGTSIICNEKVTIGRHCMLAWGSVITDSWEGVASSSILERREALRALASDQNRLLPPMTAPQPVVLEDNVWVGFDSVILPGVTLGRGCIIGSKTVISQDVEPYAVVVGSPSRIVRYLDPNDTEEARQIALRERRVLDT